MRYTHLVCVGDSWTFGNDLSDQDRKQFVFAKLLQDRLDLPLTNLGISSATNYNYKWLMTEWFNKNPNAQPLVVVGITSPLRLLIYDNQLRGFQEPLHYILENQNWFPNTYSGHNKLGGYRGIQLADPWALKQQPNLGEVGENYIRYQLDDEYRDVEIASIWEVLMLDSMTRLRGGHALFWSNLWDFKLHRHEYFRPQFRHISTINRLQKLLPNDLLQNGNLFGHPNLNGHQVIANKILEHLQLTAI